MQSYINNFNALVKVEMIEATEEWEGWDCIGDPVLQIDLRNWADLLLIAPLSAHTLAKIANGLCDDTLSCVVRAWNFDRNVGKPLILAPAMNTAMWNHPLTASQLKTIKSFGMGIVGGKEENCKDGLIHVVDPTVKILACGELGSGALADISDIVLAVEIKLHIIFSSKSSFVPIVYSSLSTGRKGFSAIMSFSCNPTIGTLIPTHCNTLTSELNCRNFSFNSKYSLD